jgi:hypothetical protein
MTPTPQTVRRPATATIDVTQCARCGGNHFELPVYELSNPTTNLPAHFSMCPWLDEPIFVWMWETE